MKCNHSRLGFELELPCPFSYDDNHYTTGTSFLNSITTSFRFLNFFPSYETCSINVNPLFHAAIKNHHKNLTASSSFILPLKLREEIPNNVTHVTNISSLKKLQWGTLTWKVYDTFRFDLLCLLKDFFFFFFFFLFFFCFKLKRGI